MISDNNSPLRRFAASPLRRFAASPLRLYVRRPCAWIDSARHRSPHLSLLLTTLATLGLFAPTSALAQSTDPIWSATLTVRETSSGILGCNEAATSSTLYCATLLTDNDFSIGGQDLIVSRFNDGGGGGEFSFGVLTSTFGRISSQANDALQAFNLCVGTTAYSLARMNDGAVVYSTSPGWSEGDMVSLSIGSRCTPAATDATLQSLSAESSTDGNDFTALPLTPVFASDTLNYAVTVANTITQARLTPTVTDSEATIRLSFGIITLTATSGLPESISLNEGENVIRLVVTAEDTSTTQTYTVTITRQAPQAVTPPETSTEDASTEANNTNQAVLPELAQALTDVSVGAVTQRIGRMTGRGAGGSAGPGSGGGSVSTSAGTNALATGKAGANAGADRGALTAADMDTGTANGTSLATTLANLARQHAHTLEQGQSLTSLLNGSAFNVPLNHLFEYREGWASTLSLWGSGSYRDLNSEKGLGWEGDVVSAQLGLDAWVSENWLLGIAGAWSEGNIDYGTSTGSNRRDYTLTLYTIHPYIAWTPSDRVQLWASGGYGQGEIETEDRRVQTDVDQWLIAGGGSLRLAQSLHLKLEAQQAWTESDRSADLAALSVKGHTLRATLEANRRMALANGTLTPSLELGARHDGGDGDTGTGAIVGATLRWQGTQGLQLDAGGEALLGRDDYEEWSVWGLIGWQAKNQRGWSFNLQPRYGREGTGTDVGQLWRHDGPGLPGLTSPTHSTLPDTQANLDLRLAHGLGRGVSLLVPYSELRLGERHRLRLGLQWRLGEQWDLDLRAERNQHSATSTTTDHSILLEGRLRH